jgi:HK97 family phage portal protein
MNLLQKIAARVLYGKGVDLRALIDNMERADGGMGKSLGSRVSEGYKKNGMAYAAISRVTTNLPSVPWILFRERDDEEDEEITRHPLIDLMRRPNPRQAQMRFLEQLILNLFLSGVSYSRLMLVDLTGPRGARRVPMLVNLRPDKTELRSEDDPLQGWVFQGKRAPVYMGPEEVLFLNFLDPVDEWGGLSPLEVAALPVNQANAARKWNWNLLKRGARPTGILSSRIQIPKDMKDKIREEFMTDIGGADQAGRIPFPTGDVEWKPTGLSPGDMEWVEGTARADRLIATTLGVPAQILGDKDASTYANYAEARKALYQERILPLLNWIIGEFNAWLIPILGEEGMYFAPDIDSIDALQEARKDEWERVRSADTLTVNEKRRAMRYDAIEGRGGGLIIHSSGIVIDSEDGQVFLPATLMPIDEAVAGAGGDGDGDGDGDDAAGWGKSATEPGPTEQLYFNLHTEAQKRAHWRGVDSSRRAFERMGKLLAGKAFAAERRRVVSAVKGAASPAAAIEAAGKVVDGGKAAWEGYYQRIYGTVGTYFVRRVSDALGKGVGGGLQWKAKAKTIVDQWMGFIRQDLLTEAADKISGIGAATKTQIRRVLDAAVESGSSLLQASEEIDNLYLDQIIPNRSEVIARTEVVSASNRASDFAAHETGLNLEKEWIATKDDRTRESHEAVDGQRVKLDAPFVVNGHDMLYPGDSSQGAPASEIIQCRCTVGYHVVGDR